MKKVLTFSLTYSSNNGYSNNWKKPSLEIRSPTVENEIDSFVTTDVENNDNGCSETLDLINGAYKNIKYKKRHLIEFMQNEIEQKLYLHNKGEY